MKVLLVNKFLYPKGGDAISTVATGDLLSEKGHQVFYFGMENPKNPDFPYREYFVSDVDYDAPLNFFQKLNLTFRILYSWEARNKIEHLLKKVKPDIVHLNNFAHQITPSILDEIEKYHLPVVMTMRDYKIVCPSYSMLAKGKPCKRCQDGRYYFCTFYRCTKNSTMKSTVNTAEMYLHHRILHLYDKIDLYISPSQFMKDLVREMGFMRTVKVLPNFIHADQCWPSYGGEEGSIVYFGRLSDEKGLETLIDAVKGLKVEVKIIGEGPLRELLASKVKNEGVQNIHFLGYKIGEDLNQEIRKSMFAILPSEWYENYPRSAMEAFALGKPVIGSRMGGIPELVRDGETGFVFEPGDVIDLREKILSLLKNKNKIIEMGKRARAFVEEELNPDRHYHKLMEIYTEAINRSPAKGI